MAVSRMPGRKRPVDPFAELLADLHRLSRYDLYLAAIPVALLVSFLAHTVAGLAIPVALVPTVGIGVAVLADALFLHPPLPTESGSHRGSRSE